MSKSLFKAHASQPGFARWLWSVLLLGLPLMVPQLFACSSKPVSPAEPLKSFKSVDANFDLGSAFRFDVKNIYSVGDGSDRLAAVYVKLRKLDGKPEGTFFRLSTDAGETFGPERSLPGGLYILPSGLVAIRHEASPGAGLNIFFSRSLDGGATWSQRTQINDEQGSFGVGAWSTGFSLVQSSSNDLYALWTDGRRGFLSLYCSASSDGGRTWSPNQPVEDDFREGDQVSPVLRTTAAGRLIAIWVDFRDRMTLADIRSSYSDDAGRNWSPSKKINDDTAHVWQVAPSAVVTGNQILIAFADFRDGGEEGDNDWNIYFTRSTDNGVSWSRNVRVNDVTPGNDESPGLAIDSEGRTLCVWTSSRRSIFGNVALSYSTDLGESWAPSALLGDSSAVARHHPPSLMAVGKRLLAQWREERFGSPGHQQVWIEASESALLPVPAVSYAESNKLVYQRGEVIFSDDFSGDGPSRWRTVSGIWMNVHGAYLGVHPTGSWFVGLAPVGEPESYELRGRFKLDPINHERADLYFRRDSSGRRYYLISNRFRFGCWLGSNEDGTAIAKGLELNGRPLVERRFPFQNNRWYDFTLVVTPDRVDYLVDGRLMLSSVSGLRLAPGSFGIGGRGAAPTSFDDIVVTEIR